MIINVCIYIFFDLFIMIIFLMSYIILYTLLKIIINIINTEYFMAVFKVVSGSGEHESIH